MGPHMNWFRNLDAMPRLLCSFGVLILLAAGISYEATSKLADANQQMSRIYQEDMQGVIHADNMNIARYDIGRISRDAILNVDNAPVLAADAKSIQSRLGNFQSELDAADKTYYSEEGISAVKAIREALPPWQKAQQTVVDQAQSHNIPAARSAMDQASELGKVISAALDRASSIKQTNAKKAYEANTAAYNSARTIMIAATLFSIAFGIVIAIVIGRGFSIPLGSAVATLEKVADGDLTAVLAVETRDEVGRMANALNRAVEKLNATLREVAESAANATSSSQQLAAASEAIASGAQQQAASLEETSASLEEITAAVRQSADNANQASQLAGSSKDSAEHGQQVVTTAITAMAEINVASAKISDIISTIDEIAFQTNLLAVNAAVEAARAGDEGRGFAVVASEVRSLAQRSAVAAKEIKVLIQDSLKKVAAGSELVNRSGETLQGIVGSVKRVTDIVGEIAAASGEQSTGIEQVNTAMTQMDQVTQSNSAQTEELSATAQSLSEQSAHLMDLVSAFTLNQSGRGARDRQPLQPRESSAIHSEETSLVTSALHSSAVAPRAIKVSRRASAAKPDARPRGGKAAAKQPALVAASSGSSGGDASFEEF